MFTRQISPTPESEAVVLKWSNFPPPVDLWLYLKKIFDHQFVSSGSEATDMARHPVTCSIIYKIDSRGLQSRAEVEKQRCPNPMISPVMMKQPPL